MSCLLYLLLVRYLTVLGRYTYVTPSSYLELLSSFKRLITQKQDSTMKAKKRYIVGLEKLAFASSQVCGLFVVVFKVHGCHIFDTRVHAP